jgi:hypothetical protein
LRGIRFTNGVLFSFTGSSLTTLAPGARVLIVKNLAAFTARYGSDLPIAGEYVGSLDNNGEQLRLLDGNGEEILDFEYDDDWFALTDGLGFSLQLVDETAAPDSWSKPSPMAAECGSGPDLREPADPVLTHPSDGLDHRGADAHRHAAPAGLDRIAQPRHGPGRHRRVVAHR